MLYKTKGIVFRFVKYRETSIIATVFTEKFGIQSYIVNSIRSKKGKSKIAFFQPLTLLDLVVYYKDSGKIHRISEMKCSHPFQSITTDFKKSTIALFLTEVLNKSIKEEGEHPELFEFLYHSIQVLDHLTVAFENFHLQFLLKLSRYLGFEALSVLQEIVPQSVSLRPYFDEKTILHTLHTQTYGSSIVMSNEQRRVVLHHILDFYEAHIDSFHHLKSVKVLRELLH